MTVDQILDLILHQHLPNGGWLDYWAQNAVTIKQFINAKKLTPISAAAVPGIVGELATGGAVRGKATPASIRILDPGIRGGIRVPHLHFDGKIFMLNKEQWGEFSGKIIEEAKANLANVNRVNFGQAMTIAQTSEALG